MQQYYDERSPAWQESECGEAFAEHLDMMQEVLVQVAERGQETQKNWETLTGLSPMAG